MGKQIGLSLHIRRGAIKKGGGNLSMMTPGFVKILVAIFILLLSNTEALSLSISRGPYLQQQTSDTIIIRWRTDTQSDSEIRYGVELGSYDATVRDASFSTEHEVKIEGLDSGKKYYYTIVSSGAQLAGDDENQYFVTSPNETCDIDARIWVIGDAGTGNSIQKSVRDAYYAYSGSRKTDLIISLGDNAYNDGLDSEYQTKFFDIYYGVMINTTLWSAFSNHDGISSNSAAQSGPYYDNFTFPKNGEAGGAASGTEAYYSFNYGNIHLITLDSFGSSREPEGEMLSWLEEDLASVQQKWIVVFWHHPPYSFGTHNSDQEHRLIDMRENVVPILDKYGVDLVLSGHSHGYERSMLIKGHYGSSSTFTNEMAVDSGDGRTDSNGAYEKACSGSASATGAVYVVLGASGGGGSISAKHPVMTENSTAPGSLAIELSGDEMNVNFLDYTGAVLDYFTIRKSCSIPLRTALRADLVSPPNGTALPGRMVRFIWTPGSGSDGNGINENIIFCSDPTFNSCNAYNVSSSGQNHYFAGIGAGVISLVMLGFVFGGKRRKGSMLLLAALATITWMVIASCASSDSNSAPVDESSPELAGENACPPARKGNRYYEVDGLEPNTTYYWKITTVDGMEGSSADSEVWSFTTGG